MYKQLDKTEKADSHAIPAQNRGVVCPTILSMHCEGVAQNT